MTTRRAPVFLAVAPNNASEHFLLSGLPQQARISRTLVDSVCMDDDINILDGRQILWAIATRFQPAEDAIIG